MFKCPKAESQKFGRPIIRTEPVITGAPSGPLFIAFGKGCATVIVVWIGSLPCGVLGKTSPH
jgi:hypothetical protein